MKYRLNIFTLLLAFFGIVRSTEDPCSVRHKFKLPIEYSAKGTTAISDNEHKFTCGYDGYQWTFLDMNTFIGSDKDWCITFDLTALNKKTAINVR